MFTLDQVVPWGRSFDEYERMFALSGADCGRRMLGCSDGPASFNAEATRRGMQVVSCDPIYRFDAVAIRARVDAVVPTVLEQARQNTHEFVWDAIPSVEALGRLRLGAMQAFLDDYPSGTADGRYVDASLPALPFTTGQFELALCSHFLFLYSAQFDEAFHVASIRELLRVASEVRVFPLLALGSAPSPHLDPVRRALEADGIETTVVTVPYEFQRGGNQMLRVTKKL